MNLITIEGVSKQYAERLLLDDVSLRVNRGDRIGLIGVNGSGKTTLLRIIAGEEDPDGGNVTVWGGVRIQYLAQEPRLDEELTVLDQLFRSDSRQMRLLRDYRRVTDELQRTPDDPQLQEQFASLAVEMDRADGWSAEAGAKAILTKLGVTDFGAPISILSGGQRKRVALARALIDPADLLILDEPTNHIDADAIAWLEEYLLDVPGALMMVTHDRYFLDRVVNRIVELDRRQLVSYSGSYSRYLELRTARHQQLVEAEERRQKLLRRELAWLRRAPKARTTKQKARRERAAELTRLAYDSGEDRVSIALAGRRLGKKVLEVRSLSKAYGNLVLFTDLSFDLGAGERIGIIGPNGSGKTTFLDVLAERVAPDSGTVTWGNTVHLGYFDQLGAALDDAQRLINFIEEEAPLILTKDGERVSAAQMLEWFLFERPQQHAQIGSLSGGERRRVHLLHALIHQPNVLFLDEPTNDLDIQTLTVLEEFLDHFQGSLIVVSHDRYFLDRTVDQLIYFEDGRFGLRYPTPYATYQRLRREAEAVRGTEQPVQRRRARTATVAQPAGHLRKLTWKEQRKMEELESRIGVLETQQGALSAEINRCGSDYLCLEALSAELAEVEAELDAAMERWVELSDISADG